MNLNFEVLIAENLDFIPETEWEAVMSIHQSLDNTNRCSFDTLFEITYV